jgi:hypothetical protein
MTLLLNTIRGVEVDNGIRFIYGLIHTVGYELDDLIDNATIEREVDGVPRVCHISDLPEYLQVLVRSAIKERFEERAEYEEAN